jgi:hypothetical protein
VRPGKKNSPDQPAANPDDCFGAPYFCSTDAVPTAP